MKKIEHTPGPWIAFLRNSWSYRFDVKMPSGESITANSSDEEKRGDLLIISKSPDLYHALFDLVDDLKNGRDTVESGSLSIAIKLLIEMEKD